MDVALLHLVSRDDAFYLVGQVVLFLRVLLVHEHLHLLGPALLLHLLYFTVLLFVDHFFYLVDLQGPVAADGVEPTR